MWEQIALWCLSKKRLVWEKQLKKCTAVTGTPMFFAGGPVWATAWCPIPLQKAIYRTAHMNQYLAVSCHSGMEDTYISGQRYSHNGLIQIWDFGHLDNQQ
jgi:hypothetical protein